MNITTYEVKHWFALKVFYNKVFEIEEALKKDKRKSYIPCEEVLVEHNGKKKTVRKPVINSLMFFRSTIKHAIEIQQRFMNKVIVYTSSGERGMEYFGEDNSKFQKGERVRIIDGKFKGAEGIICRIRKNRRLVVTVQGICAVATSYIPQSFLQRIG